MIDSVKTYAKVAWTLGDIQELRPDWDDEQCINFLRNNQNHIQSRLIELGWDVLKDLIAYEETEENNNA